MAITKEKLNTEKAATGEAELLKSHGAMGKWLGEIEQRLGDAEPVIKLIQDRAAEVFAKTGIPGRKDEEYKYTNIRKYLTEDFTARSGQIKISEEILKQHFQKDCINLVFINDFYAPQYSELQKLPQEIAAGDLYINKKGLQNAVVQNFNKLSGESKNPMALLNTALAGNGFYLFVRENYICKTPIHIVKVIAGENKSLINPRNLVSLQKNARLTLIESSYQVGSGKIFTNSLTELFAEENAVIENYILQDENAGSFHNDARFFSIGKGAKSSCVTITLNGSMIRNDASVLLHGEHAEAHLTGLFIVKDDDHTDNHTLMEHLSPNCSSKELYKGIIGDRATGVFNGKIYVHPQAQKTDAYQSNKNILMSDKASVNTKPQLEIYADDVRCSHGTTTGRLNEEALFYLESRGLNKHLAKKMLLQAFASEVCNAIGHEPFRTFIEQRIVEKLK